MKYVYEVGDEVVLIDGTNINNCSGYMFIDDMREYVGEIGIVNNIFEEDGEVYYSVEFENDDGYTESYLCKKEWLYQGSTLTSSEDLDAMFSDFGGAE